MQLRARAARHFRVTTTSNPTHPIAPNLLERRFQTAAADRIWLGDITYLDTGEGWLYLAAILDTYSRRIVGWTTSARLDRDFVVEALDRALAARCPQQGLLHHSDRGTQYTSGEYRDRLAAAGFLVSMSRSGDCWDNAMMESFFKTLKTELGHRFTTRAEARRELFDSIEGFYNTRRLHSSLGYLSPAEFERRAGQVEAAA